VQKKPWLDAFPSKALLSAVESLVVEQLVSGDWIN